MSSQATTESTALAPEHRSRLALHGMAAALAGMLGGMAFLFNILKFIQIFPLVPRINYRVRGSEAAWRAAHTGPIMNGMLLMLVSALGPIMKLDPRAQRGLVGSLLVTVWGNTLGYNAAALAEDRGLTHRGNKLGRVAYYAFLSAALAVLVAIPISLLGLRRHREEEDSATTP